MHYRHLTQDERYTLKTLRKAGFSNKKIAALLGRHPCTIGREISRNSGRNGYHAKQAHCKAMERAQRPTRVKFNEATGLLVKEKLEQGWSPEQISGWLRGWELPSISHERIYQFIYDDARAGGEIWKNLRCCKRRRRRRCPGRKRRGLIRNRRLIDTRPDVVSERNRIGDWEADLVVGRQSGPYLVTIVERSTLKALVGFSRTKSATEVGRVITRLFKGVPEKYRKTLTFDNGKEFAGHEKIAAKTGMDVYFANPYHSWERGTNENFNGLLRQYFPKGSDFRDLDQAMIADVMNKINSRPRKTLGFMTPDQAFAEGIPRTAVPASLRSALCPSGSPPTEGRALLRDAGSQGNERSEFPSEWKNSD